MLPLRAPVMDPGIGVQRRIRYGLRSWVRDCPSGNAPLHRNFRLAWLKYLIYTHRILILLINPIFYSHHLHIIGSLLTSVFLWALSQEVGIIYFLLGNYFQYHSHNTTLAR